MTRAEETFDRALEACECPDDSIGNEMRIFGPPGTGKTTTLAKHIERAAQRFGAKGLLVMSHTRAAARELVNRDIALADQNVATVHSICYRALGNPRIAETISERWNKQYPGWALSPHNKAQHLEDTPLETQGDRLIRRLNTLRATMTPESAWPESLIPFARAWRTWKRLEGAMDFTDLIANALQSVAIAPGNPNALIIDEAQDLTPLQLALIRSWGKAAGYVLLAGDDDQAIYDYAGATPQNLLLPALAPHQIRVLRESKRVPRVPQSYAYQQWTSRLKLRHPKYFRPRDAQGCVRRIDAGAFDAQRLVDRIERSLARPVDCDVNGRRDRQVMLLASANFALQNVLAELRRRGLPFSNRYRSENLRWNPLGGKGHGAASRVQALCAARERLHETEGMWTGVQVRLWSTWLAASGTLIRGGKEKLLGVDFDRSYGLEFLRSTMLSEAIERLMEALVRGAAATAEWWRHHVLEEYVRDVDFAARVVRARGLGELSQQPRLTIGTIHSVKGGQADTVYLLPDLTNRWMSDMLSGGARRDALLRLFYVASTRTSDELFLCAPWRRGSAMQLGAAA